MLAQARLSLMTPRTQQRRTRGGLPFQSPLLDVLASSRPGTAQQLSARGGSCCGLDGVRPAGSSSTATIGSPRALPGLYKALMVHTPATDAVGTSQHNVTAAPTRPNLGLVAVVSSSQQDANCRTQKGKPAWMVFRLHPARLENVGHGPSHPDWDIKSS